jgi:uncharacterized protein YndB with AHSA1/START domain
VVSASREIAARPERIYELITDPAEQPRWDLERIRTERTRATCTYDWPRTTDERCMGNHASRMANHAIKIRNEKRTNRT